MKKQLLKLTILAVTFFSISLINAQEYEEYTKPGLYTIGAADGSGLLITIDPVAPGFLKWAAPIDGGSPTQQFAVTNHAEPMSSGYVQITAEIPGIGAVRLGTTPENIEGGSAAPSKNITVIMLAGPVVVDKTADNYGYDQFQRRKTSTNRGGNDALFIKVPGQGGSRYGVTAAEGDPIKFDGGPAIGKIEYKFISILDADEDGIDDHLDQCPNEAGVEDLVQETDEDGNPVVDEDGNPVMVNSDVHGCPAGTASVNTFNTEEFSIANPINNTLTIKGATSEINKVVVYSVLGNQVLSKSINNNNGDININVSSLATGLYIVELNGVSGQRLTKKIIKQ